MKKQNSLSYLIFMMVFAIAACNPSKEKAQGVSNTTEAPSVDIHTAVISGNTEAVKQHIKAGTDLNQAEPMGGSSPLISAAVFNKPEIFKLLLDAGVDIDFQNNDGSTALHSAAYFCHPELVKMLLDKGADKTIRNKYGVTAYETVAGPYSEAEQGYKMMADMLAPVGLKLDFKRIEKTRPQVAKMLI